MKFVGVRILAALYTCLGGDDKMRKHKGLEQISLEGIEPAPPITNWSESNGQYTTEWEMSVLLDGPSFELDLIPLVGFDISITWKDANTLLVKVQSELPALDTASLAVFFQLLRPAFLKGAIRTIQGVEANRYASWFGAR